MRSHKPRSVGRASEDGKRGRAGVASSDSTNDSRRGGAVSVTLLSTVFAALVTGGIGYFFARFQYQEQVNSEVARARNATLIEVLEPMYSETLPPEMVEAATAAKYLKYLMLADSPIISESAQKASSAANCRQSWEADCVDLLVEQLQAERKSFGRDTVSNASLKAAMLPSLEVLWKANNGRSNSMFFLSSFNNDLQVNDVPEINFSDIPIAFQHNFPREKFIIVVSSAAVPGVLSGDGTLCYASAGVSRQPMWRTNPSVPSVQALGFADVRGKALPIRKACALTAIRRAFATLFSSPPESVFPTAH